MDHASLPFDGLLLPWHRTLRMLERFYCWTGMNLSPGGGFRHCLKCQSRKTPRLTVRWSIISMLLLQGPGIAISFDYYGLLPITPGGNTYILLITDRFSRRADLFAVTAAEFTTKGTGNIPVNKYIPLWGCPRTLGQRPAVLLQAFTSCLPAVGSAQDCHKLLSSKRQRRR